ncbi:foldase protein PrsA [Clostridium cavendishii DSM 21758]|uniref:peptidylprolyl isomerase n=1 Tax=Clostridium cavendishii DSM 21758 TaxID=1121302 RepID=A0A1M6P9A6_9CLOT|nr:peptidylprolyl isomerase [Clostridium cavendishii]SHK04487.1 foldase protein PrsA [Clostridium cavendishii DSM 21758]
MKNVKKVVVTAIAGVLMFSVFGCDMIQKTPEAVRKTTVAKVDGDKITLGEVDDKMKPLIEQMKSQYGDKYDQNQEAKDALAKQRKDILDGMVNEKVVIKEAAKLKVGQDKADADKFVDERIKQVKTAYGNDDKKLEEALKTNGMTMDTFKEYMKNQYIQQKLQEYIGKDLKVTDAEVDKYYETNKEQYTKDPGATIYHIVVPTEDEIKKIKEEYDKGAKFEDLAAKYGTDGTKNTGGSLGFVPFSTDKMDKDFMAAAKKLKEGEVSGPVKSQFGWHLIKVANVKDSIKQNLLKQKEQEETTKKLETWKKELKVEVYEDKIK